MKSLLYYYLQKLDFLLYEKVSVALYLNDVHKKLLNATIIQMSAYKFWVFRCFIADKLQDLM